jgi:hypothetical protein
MAPASVVDHRKVADVSQDDLRKVGEAADKLWQDLKRAVAEQRRLPCGVYPLLRGVWQAT